VVIALQVLNPGTETFHPFPYQWFTSLLALKFTILLALKIRDF